MFWIVANDNHKMHYVNFNSVSIILNKKVHLGILMLIKVFSYKRDTEVNKMKLLCKHMAHMP